MSETRTQESEKKKLRKMKAKVVDLRGILACCTDPKDKEDLSAMLAGARFMHDLYEKGVFAAAQRTRQAKRAERVRSRQRRWVKWLVKAVTVAVLLAIIFLSASCQFVSGCGTAIKGLGGDIQWAADGYMEEMGKK